MSEPQAQTLRRAITPEIRVLSENDGTVKYIASDETVDCYAEIVRAKGWRFDRFARNAPFVDSHCYYEIQRLLGKVTDFAVIKGRLEETVKWAIDVPEQKLAQLGFRLTLGGYLKAVSVGFTSLRRAYAGTPEFAAAVKEMKLDADTVARVQCIHLEQDQLELSACIIGANPSALAKSLKDGAVSEGLLAECGFSSDAELNFLAQSAEVYERLEPWQRAMVHTEMRRIFAHGKTLSLGGTSAPVTSPGGSGGGDATQHRKQQEAQQRETFLSDLDAALRGARAA